MRKLKRLAQQVADRNPLTLLASPMLWLELRPEEARALIDPVFDAYMCGLDAEGWRGNVDQVRVTFLTRLFLEALRKTYTITRSVVDVKWKQFVENLVGHPIEEIADRYAATHSLYLDCKAEAQRLAQRSKMALRHGRASTCTSQLLLRL